MRDTSFFWIICPALWWFNELTVFFLLIFPSTEPQQQAHDVCQFVRSKFQVDLFTQTPGTVKLQKVLQSAPVTASSTNTRARSRWESLEPCSDLPHGTVLHVCPCGNEVAGASVVVWLTGLTLSFSLLNLTNLVHFPVARSNFLPKNLAGEWFDYSSTIFVLWPSHKALTKKNLFVLRSFDFWIYPWISIMYVGFLFLLLFWCFGQVFLQLQQNTLNVLINFCDWQVHDLCIESQNSISRASWLMETKDSGSNVWGRAVISACIVDWDDSIYYTLMHRNVMFGLHLVLSRWCWICTYIYIYIYISEGSAKKKSVDRVWGSEFPLTVRQWDDSTSSRIKIFMWELRNLVRFRCPDGKTHWGSLLDSQAKDFATKKLPGWGGVRWVVEVWKVWVTMFHFNRLIFIGFSGSSQSFSGVIHVLVYFGQADLWAFLRAWPLLFCTTAVPAALCLPFVAAMLESPDTVTMWNRIWGSF